MIEGKRSEGGYYRLDAAARARLEPPALDAKVLTGWNGLAIGALARAGFVFDAPAAVESARRAADFLIEHHLLGDGTRGARLARRRGVGGDGHDRGHRHAGRGTARARVRDRRGRATRCVARELVDRAIAAAGRCRGALRRTGRWRSGARRARAGASGRPRRGRDALGHHGVRGCRVAALRARGGRALPRRRGAGHALGGRHGGRASPRVRRGARAHGAARVAARAARHRGARLAERCDARRRHRATMAGDDADRELLAGSVPRPGGTRHPSRRS